MICDSCITAFGDEGFPEEVTPAYAREFGSMLPDHDCDSRETGERCACSGHTPITPEHERVHRAINIVKTGAFKSQPHPCPLCGVGA